MKLTPKTNKELIAFLDSLILDTTTKATLRMYLFMLETIDIREEKIDLNGFVGLLKKFDIPIPKILEDAVNG